MFLPRISPQRSRHPTTCTEHQLITPPSRTSLSGPHHERVAGPRCTVVASCSIGGCDPSSVTTAFLLRCAVHVCVRRREKYEFGSLALWSKGHDARFWIWWREFEPRRITYLKTKRYSTTLWLFYLPDFYFANQRSRQCNSSTYGQNNILYLVVLVCIQNMIRIVLVYGTRCTSYVHIIRYRSRI